MSRNWLKTLFPAPNRRRISSKPRLQLMALEDRTVPATLTQIGTTATIDLDITNEQLTVHASGVDQVTIDGNFNGQNGSFSLAGVTA